MPVKVMTRSEGGQTTSASQEPKTLDPANHSADHEDGGN